MRTIFICLWLALSATAQTPLGDRGGQFLSVRVEGTPPGVTRAVLDLNSDLPGLPLEQVSTGAWTGGFAILPSLVEGLMRPNIRLLDGAGREQATGEGSGVRVELASSDFDQEGLATVLADRTALFVFDGAVDPKSIKLLTEAGLVLPIFLGQTFTLPDGVASRSVTAVVARTSGVNLVFVPDWSANVSTVDEL